MERGYIVFNQTFKPTAHQCASIAIQYDVTVIIIIQVIYIALFTAASQRLQFTISKQKEKRKSTSVKTIRPLSLPVPIPAQRARKPSQMQQKTNSSHLPPPAGPTGVHPDAVPLTLFSLAYASRVQTSFLCCCNPTVFAEFCSHPVRSILFLRYIITSDHFDVNFI